MYLFKKLENIPKKIKVFRKPKIFGIGQNKTGTTSLITAMENLGFVSGHQGTAEKMLKDWGNRDFNKIISYCHTAQFFQDVPFSLPFTYIVLDHAFPRSKFILTVRDSPMQWYNSIVKFHSRLWAENGRIPDGNELENAEYLYKGWAMDFNKLVFNTPDDDLYNQKILINFYENYVKNVTEYFRHRPNDLLVLNVAKPCAYKELCEFLGVECTRNEFPWVNKTNDI